MGSDQHFRGAVGGVILALAASWACAGEIRVISGGAARLFVEPLAKSHQDDVMPDISTAQALRQTLLAANTVVYMDPRTGTSGKHVAQVLERLGVAEEVNRKATLGQGGYVVAPVGRGEIELGIPQISEILPVRGVKLVGELPAELQKYTVYVASVLAVSANRAAVNDFIRHLRGPQAQERLASAGYTAPD
jgi:molybdate transport system substrate-binding protein